MIEWVDGYQIKHNAVDSLLKILKKNGHDQLPKSARSLIKPARYVPIYEKSGMQYIYFPVKEELMWQFLRYQTMMKESMTTLELSLNIDGLPLFKSSNKTLWPVHCGIMNVELVVILPVALTYGSSKPPDLLFLQYRVDDLNHLLEHGLNVDGKVIPVLLRCIVCNAPARALVKSTKLYSGSHTLAVISVTRRESGLAELFTQKPETLTHGQAYLFIPSQMLLIITMIPHSVICPSIWFPNSLLITCISYVL